jgi:hypothetical protein
MPTDEDIRAEARRRHPSSKPRNYLNEGEQIGFIEGAKAYRDNKIKQINLRDELIKFIEFQYNIIMTVPLTKDADIVDEYLKR